MRGIRLRTYRETDMDRLLTTAYSQGKIAGYVKGRDTAPRAAIKKAYENGVLEACRRIYGTVINVVDDPSQSNLLHEKVNEVAKDRTSMANTYLINQG